MFYAEDSVYVIVIVLKSSKNRKFIGDFKTFNTARRETIFNHTSLFALCLVGYGTRNNMQVAHYSTKEGLPHDIMLCSLKSEDSFLWFGTWFGLSVSMVPVLLSVDAYISSSGHTP